MSFIHTADCRQTSRAERKVTGDTAVTAVHAFIFTKRGVCCFGVFVHRQVYRTSRPAASLDPR